MRVLIAPDSFKGSLSAASVSAALADGWARARPQDCIVRLPVADGGEGTLDALVAAWNGRVIDVDVTGPLGQPVRARYGLTRDGRTAVVEMAEASGLLLTPHSHRDPGTSTTFGTGELLNAALERGAERIIVAVGGSATNDGGAGMAQALGARLLDGDGTPLPPGGEALHRLARVDVSGMHPRLSRTQFIVAADVDNPLTGSAGASRVFGPQKGADAATVVLLEEALTHYASIVETSLQTEEDAERWRDMPGAGAAGGLAFGLAAFCEADIRSGADVVLDALDFDARLEKTDLVLTGEGRLDGQSKHGKAPVAVARRARRRGIPVVGVAGVLGPGTDGLRAEGMTAAVCIAEGPMDVKTSMERAGPLLAACGERLARLIEIGWKLRRA